MDTTITRSSAPPPGRNRRRPLLLGSAVVVGVLALLVLAFVGLRLSRPGALPGSTVSGVPVGGLDGPELRAAVATAGAGDDVVTVVRDDATWEATGSELGYAMDVDATVERVLERGRQLNPIAALGDHLRAFSTTTEVAPVESVDDGVLREQVEAAAAALRLDPREGAVEVEGTTVQRTEPRPGAAVEVDPLADEVRAALRDRGDDVIDAPTTVIETETTPEEVADAAASAEAVVSAPIALTRGDVTLDFTPDQLGALLQVEREGGDLNLRMRPEDVAAMVPPETVEALYTEPVDARFEVGGGNVTLIGSADGFAFDAATTAEQLLQLATGAGDRTAELAGEVLAPERSTADAEALGITERVSTFTTQHPCCQGRVTNIQRMADTVNGVIIEPGETFSLNGYVGERTREKGYVDGGAIQQGEFVEQVGGGVSQFTTTMFNAAFFGGYAIPDYKAHSYYISRYPAGREATLNYPTVDLKIHNNSPYGILVATSYTSTSITVSFYGTTWVEVESTSSPRRNVTQPQTRIEENRNLAPGASRVVQSGRQGFDITVTRHLRFPDGRSESEEFFTRYLAEPRIVQRNTAPPAPDPAPAPESAPAPAPEDGGGGEEGDGR